MNDLNNTAPTTTATVKTILDSYNSGQGKTYDAESGFILSDLIKLDNLKLSFRNCHLSFISKEHLEAFFLLLAYRSFKDLSKEQIDKTYKHMSKGFIGLGHSNSETEDNNLFADFTDLFVELGAVNPPQRIGKSQKFELLFEVTAGRYDLIIKEKRIINHGLVMDGISPIGVTIQLPKKEK